MAKAPDNERVRSNLGNALAACGELEKAIAQYRQSLKIKPGYDQGHYNLGVALARRGQTDEAIAHFEKALQINPCYIDAHNNLGVVLARHGSLDEAIARFQVALQLKPNHAEAHNNLANAMAILGRLDEAIAHYQKALEVNRDYEAARDNLGFAESQRDKIRKTLAEKRELLRVRTDDLALLNDTAWTLATNPNASIRNGPEAVELAQRAARLSDAREPAILGTLAAAYAEAGRFPEAVKSAEQALALATSQNNVALADALRVRIKLYQADSPYRDTQPPSGPKSIRP